MKQTLTSADDAPHSIEVGRNSKGEYSFVAQVYFDRLDSAKRRIEAVDRWIKEFFLKGAAKK